MADQEYVERLKRGVDEWNQWRRQRPTLQPDLSGAFLSRIVLSGADLSGVILSEAILSGADLSGTDLSRATLSGTVLRGAVLSRAKLREALLYRTYLREADLSYARFFNTTFAWVDLSKVKKLETAIHEGPSTINVNSVKLPPDEYTRLHFLRGVGFTDTFIDYLPSLLTIPIQYHSLFLSYSHHDQVFTKQLHTDLQNSGVRCWFAPHDLRPGTPIVRGIEEAIYLHEKLLLILSRDAVMSSWVQQEVEAALYKEATTGQEMLFPIRLDNTVLESETLLFLTMIGLTIDGLYAFGQRCIKLSCGVVIYLLLFTVIALTLLAYVISELNDT